jgi:hypothetical protein
MNLVYKVTSIGLCIGLVPIQHDQAMVHCWKNKRQGLSILSDVGDMRSSSSVKLRLGWVILAQRDYTPASRQKTVSGEVGNFCRVVAV